MTANGHAPDAMELAAAFDLGVPLGPAEWVAIGWGGHNQIWRLVTSRGSWAIKQVGRELSLDPNAALALELAAYAGGLPMPRPVPTATGACLAMLDGGRYRCHEWIDGASLPWHGHAPATAAAVGGVLASVHNLRLPWSAHLAPEGPGPGMTRWLALAESARACGDALRASLERALPSIEELETPGSAVSRAERMIGSHRDLHPTNVMRVDEGRVHPTNVMRVDEGRGLVLVDWDAAGPVVPVQEVVCFALVFAERGNTAGYDTEVVRAFMQGYRDAGGHFTFSGREDLAMVVQGRLWWTEQNLRLALAPGATATQRDVSALLLRRLEQLPAELSEMSEILFAGAEASR